MKKNLNEKTEATLSAIARQLSELVDQKEISSFRLIALGPVSYPDMTEENGDFSPFAPAHVSGAIVEDDTGLHANMIIDTVSQNVAQMAGAKSQEVAARNGVRSPPRPPSALN